jgi:DNA-binding winged helix-turn-helix (wHTH) protein/tetratricopeptide (TPR) repeat protein
MKAFGSFRLDTVNNCLCRANERVPITPKAFDVLRYLVEHADRRVTPDELLEALWPNTYVNPEGIRKYILEVRKVLGDPADKPAFIETLPKRGYQFIAAVNDDSQDTRVHVAAQPRANIVGRQAGLAELDRCLETALGGRRQLVFVTGEAGIGKTTLVDLFHQQALRRPDVRFARGQCIEGFGGVEAYYPILEALGSLLQDPANSFLVQTLARRAPTWLIQFPALVKSDEKETLQREILGSTRERMVRELCEALEVIAAQTPLVIVLEDLHWVDPSTLDLISALARRREPARLFLVATFRPVDVILSQSPLKPLKQDLLVRRLCHEISVERLEESDVSDYLAQMFPAPGLPSGLSGMIHQNSGGNPLFMAAILQDMVNKGLIAEAQGRVVLSVPVDELYPGIPETLQQMLEIQLEQLSPEDQRVLQSASVAGERFSVWAAAAMLDASPDSIEDRCDKLANRRQFIRSVGTHEAPDGTLSTYYEFRHSLYRQALYRSLSGLNRSQLHLSLGEKLMPVCAGAKPELAAEVALHFEAGRDFERAARHLILAAENSARRFSYRGSVQVLRRGLELIANLAPEIRCESELQILRRLGNAHYALGEMSDSAVAYEAAADIAHKAGRRTTEVYCLVHLAVPLWYTSPARGEDVCRQALDLSRQLADPVLAAKAQLVAASLRLLNDLWRQEDAELCNRAYQVFRSNSDPGTPPDVFYVYVEAIQGDYHEALKHAEAVIKTTNNPTGHVLAFGAKGLIHLCRGNFGETLRIVRRGRELAEKDGEDPWMFIFGDVWLRLLCADFEGVRSVSSLLMRSNAEQHAAFTRAVCRISSGYDEAFKGNFAKALRFFAEVRDFQITPKFFLHWQWRMHATLGAAEVLLVSGDSAAAHREADGLLQSTLEKADPNMQVLAWEIKARVAVAEQDPAGARRCIEQALAILRRFELPIVAWQVHRTASNWFREEGDQARAAEHRARAEEVIMNIANSFEPGEPLRESFLAAPHVQRVLARRASA